METKMSSRLASVAAAVLFVSLQSCWSENATTPNTASGGLDNDTFPTQGDLQIILETHNKARREERAADMINLAWNSHLAMIAQNWTDACNFTHQPPHIRKWGENLAAISNSKPRADQLTSMIDQWVEEKRYNIRGTFEECCSFHSSLCCHYTQVIWSRTTSVGCGFSSCANLTYGTGTLNNISFLACYYYPSGNMPRVTYDWRPFFPLGLLAAGPKPSTPKTLSSSSMSPTVKPSG